jgi:hypothetical protein
MFLNLKVISLHLSAAINEKAILNRDRHFSMPSNGDHVNRSVTEAPSPPEKVRAFISGQSASDDQGSDLSVNILKTH